MYSDKSNEDFSSRPKKTRGDSTLKKQQRIKSSTVAEDLILQVYNYWLSVMRPGRGRVPALDDKRRLKVASAIHDYGVEDCMRAIDGCKKSDFHMGRNKARRRYDDIELIFRDQDHIERFLGLIDEGSDW